MANGSRAPTPAPMFPYFVASVIGVGAVLFGAAAWRLPHAVEADATLWFLTIMVVFGQFLGWRLPGGDGRTEMSFTVPFGLALLLLHGPVAAVLIEVTATLLWQVVQRRPAVKVAFNGGLTAIGVMLAALVLTALTGTTLMPAVAGPTFLAAFFAAGMAYLLWTNAAVTAVIGMSRGEPARLWVHRVVDLPGVVSSVLLVALAPIVVAAAERSPWLMPLPAVPVLLAEALIREGHRRRYETTHDAETGLPNLPGLLQVLEGFEEAGEHRIAVFAVRMANIEDLGEALGKPNLNSLIGVLSTRLSDAVPEAEITRTGDDTFSLAVRGPGDGIEQRLATLLSEPLQHGALSVVVECTVGVARWPDHAPRPVELPERARAAAHGAARAGDFVHTYLPGSDEQRQARLALLADLGEAIADDQLVLWYQPKVRLLDGAVNGVEALVRWEHPQRGLLFPDEFVPLAERTVLIDPLTRAVLRMALRQVAAWRAAGHQLHVGVNVSVRNLSDPAFPDVVTDALLEAGLPAEALQVEVTESAVAADVDAARAVLEQLRSLGVRTAIDDFGTGYSSMAQLRNLPFDVLKVDRSFVTDLGPAGPQVPLVRALRQLGAGLDLEVVAEGLETEAGTRTLVDLGYEVGQGYWICRPIDGQSMTAWLAARRGTAVGSGVD